MGGGGPVLRVWKQWGIQILVVASFLLQLILLIFGGLRRRSSSAVLLPFLWLSYLMADNIAVYAFGHMTLESRPRDAGLVAFWATFFLLHLGGQDNITAFSMEDNQLWRRHLLTLLMQASGAGYAIYRYTIPGTWTLVSATIVMFIVGFLKYGERVWALQSGNNDNFGLWQDYYITTQELADILKKSRDSMDREEAILLDSHYMFFFCKGAFFNVSRVLRFLPDYLDRNFRRMGLPYKCNMDMYDLVEAELSLLYDLFYTKAQVVHTRQGYWIRAISLLGTVSSFLLFCLDGGAHGRVDVSITYLLLVGAIILETTSVFSVAGSTWTCAYLHHCARNRTNAMVMCLRQLFKAGGQRRWLHSIGQYNMFEYYCRTQSKCTNLILEANILQAWWRKMSFSGNTPISVKFKELVLARILRTMTDNSKIWDVQGKAVLTEYGIFDDVKLYRKDRDMEGTSLSDSILSLHVATEIYFHFCNDQQHKSRHLNTEADDKPLVEAIKVLSNYMCFLTIHPSLLPGGVPRDIYRNGLSQPWNHRDCLTTKEFARSLLDDDNKQEGSRFRISAVLAGKLLENKWNVPMLQVIFGVWVEFLCYAAHHSTEVSHIKQLGRGGEFLTVIRLVIDHIELFQKYSEIVSAFDNL